MNQILVTKKLYITPELRRKKKLYRFEFFISVFLVCLLFSYYIYAEYDRSVSEEKSQEILQGFRYKEEVKNENDTTTRNVEDDVIIVALEANEQQVIETPEIETISNNTAIEYTADNGEKYTVEAELNIPRLGINYPVIAQTSEELLKISVNKYWGPEPNKVGNYCIVGHNYKNNKMFGRLKEIENGDIVELTDGNNKTIQYEVYDRYVVNPSDVSCTSQLTNGKKEVTLITCTNYGQERLVVKAKEV